jgi:hypothetical protein
MRDFLGSDKKPIKHKVGWCANCGYVHDNVRQFTFAENGVTVIKPLCRKCRTAEAVKRQVVCAFCGVKNGSMLYPTTVERLQFDGSNTCNFIVLLCEECKTKPHTTLRETLNSVDVCKECGDRFKCYTSQHDKPRDSHTEVNKATNKPFQIFRRTR